MKLLKINGTKHWILRILKFFNIPILFGIVLSFTILCPQQKGLSQKTGHQAFIVSSPLKPFIIDLNGSWNFAVDSENQGEDEMWYDTNFNDNSWPTLESGKGWQDQGIKHTGFGWYRKKIIVPKEYAGVPLTLNLAKISYDDDVWFNGVHVGGLKGAYKYKNLALRTYSVPPSLIRYGEQNTIAIRIWGLDGIGVEGNNFGLASGPYTAVLDPYLVTFCRTDHQDKEEQTTNHFDLSEGQSGMPFEIVLRFPAEKFNSDSGKLQYTLLDFYNHKIDSGVTQIAKTQNGVVLGIVHIDEITSRAIYLRGRFKIHLKGYDLTHKLLFEETKDVDHFSFQKRDELVLPVLSHKIEETPYGKLKLVDVIDCSLPVSEELHPYMESGFDSKQLYNTPGSPVTVRVSDILGKKARESDNGWFAYRIGRGKLKPHSTYLVRIEYPEDKPRYCPIEIQTGENFMDIGWKNGPSADNPYDNWPLSNKWQWFDAIVPLDDETTGTSGSAGASAENGFWIYFMNKKKYPLYFPQYQGGPAVSRIKLYEIDAEENAPVIIRPAGLPERILMVDWERQPLQQPADVVRYSKLMGYNAVSPVILKWNFMNYGEPLNGYNSYNVDERDNWIYKPYSRNAEAKPALPEKESVHVKYLAATKQYGIHYIPRIEYGGSLNLPDEAKAIGSDGKIAKPNRFADWSANLLHPSTWVDMEKLVNHLTVPYIKDNPQLTGLLWRIRSERGPISYGIHDIRLFGRETGIILPKLSNEEMSKWASSGQIQDKYVDWWHKKRRDFQVRLADLLKSYRSDMKLYYYNWDDDKFSLGDLDLNGWGFLGVVDQKAKINPDSAFAVYTNNFKKRASYTAQDYIEMIKKGNILLKQNAPIPHNALRPDLYKKAKGVELFAPSHYRYLAEKADYLNYFSTYEGLAVSNVVSYDEVNARSINPKYEGSMMTPGGPAFSMALELLAYFHGDARSLTYTPYTYGRGFANAHRRFAQAFLSLPAIKSTMINGTDNDVKIRVYPSKNGVYVGVASKAYSSKTISVKIPSKLLGQRKNLMVKDLVTGNMVSPVISGNELKFNVNSEAMQLNTFLIQ
jgi:hypothetical protein